MAYYLQFDGVNDYVSLPFSVAIPAASNGSVIFTAESPADSEVYGMFGGIGERFIIRSSDIFFRLNGTNGNTITHATIRTFVPTYDRANKHTYELRKTLYIDGVRTQVHLYIDGVYCGLLISHYNSTGPDIKFNSIGGALTNYARMNLYSFDIVVNGVYTVRYDPSASNGTGTILIDTVGGNNGTLVNFPSDNSQWVFYDDGGAANESTVNYDLGAIDYAVSGQITAPANAASVSYDIGEIDYAVSAQQIAPGNSASLSYDIGEISYAVSAQQSAPQFSASVGYEIGDIGFAVQANTGTPANAATAIYDLGSIGYSISAQSIAPQLSAILAYDIGGIDYAVNANTGTPIRAATVGYEIGDISWQVNAQWQPSDALAIIGYDIGSIGFLVQARSGDVVVSSASDAGLSFKELARGLSFKEQPRGIKFTEPPSGVRV